ncbi:MAG: heavy-metal-associated domain-containing protein [Lentimicrobium sp.]|nr:heavy-metal-associated domain-containing protein [Lentimicrobium sp.]
MKTLKFKTTLKCNGCVSSVKPGLDALLGTGKWEVDLTSPDRTLKAEVESDEMKEKIIRALENAGHKVLE